MKQTVEKIKTVIEALEKEHSSLLTICALKSSLYSCKFGEWFIAVNKTFCFLRNVLLVHFFILKGSLYSEEVLMSKIIYHNGPSSSGKTTIAKALQESLLEPYLHIGIDKIIGFMPANPN